MRHGLTAETVIGALEDAEDYKAFEQAVIADYDAQSTVERELKRDARKHVVHIGHARCRHGDARGLEVSPGGLPENEFIQRQIRYRSSQSPVLGLQFLQPLDLIAPQPAKLLAPAIIGHPGNANLTDRVADILTL